MNNKQFSAHTKLSSALRSKAHDNLFNADHRTAMIMKNKYTEAMGVTLDDLCYESTMELAYRQERGQ